eukprot:scaffold1007_cov61-Phaeocystis_antarctica.AAC.10
MRGCALRSPPGQRHAGASAQGPRIGTGFGTGTRPPAHLREVIARHLLHHHLLAHDHVTGAAVAEEHRCAEGALSDRLDSLVLGEERLRRARSGASVCVV